MKRLNRYRRRTRRGEPGVCAWLLLIAAWLVVLPVAVSVGAAVIRGLDDGTAETFAAEQPEAEAARPFEVTARYTRIVSLRCLRSEQPTILIYHTHTTEAYTQTEQNRYTESGEWRTTDNTKNVVAVGEALKEILERDYGFLVIHDTTDHEPPKLATAYERSLVTMQTYHERYPSIVLFLDLHRDAYTAESAPTDYLTVDGTETARLMFVVGKGEKYAEKPYFEADYALAQRISQHLNSIAEKLARPVRVKTGRYNQHVAPNCLLVEVGHNANTLEQAIASMPYLAESIAYAFAQAPSLNGAFVPN